MSNLNETAFTIDSSSIKFGNSVTEEVGWEFERLNCKNIMVVTAVSYTHLTLPTISSV